LSTSGTITKQPKFASATEPAPEREPVVVEQRSRRFAAAALALAAVAAGWALVGSAWIFPQLSANSDEGIYLLQADALESGHLAPPAPAVAPDAFLPWFAVVRDGSYVLKYTPVHAAVLAAGDIALGSARGALAFLAAANVLLVIALARELGASRRAALVAGGIFLASPLVLQLSITYLSYDTSLALLLLAAVAALRAVRTRQRGYAFLAGFAWGLAAFARPYDALLGGLALVLAIIVRERSRVAELLPLAGWAIAGTVLPLGALLAFDHAMTGSAFRLPFNLLEPSDRPGFGLRRALPSDAAINYRLPEAGSALGRNLLLVSAWTGGGLVACALAVTAIVRRRLPGGAFLVSLLVVWPAGYFFFWGSYLTAYVWDGALFLGPYYYLPMTVAISIGAAASLAELAQWRPSLAVVAGVAMLLLSLAVIGPALSEQRDRTSPRAAVADALEHNVHGNALVFVPPLYGAYLQNPFSFLRNTAERDGRIVYALDRGSAANREIMRASPGRTAYRLVVPHGWSDQPGFTPHVSVEVLSRTSG
jgi:4-amino-4-deoxy-L-arabinose transferase-like glycosyltransferase